MSTMNAIQMLDSLVSRGFDPMLNGHLMVVTDVWTGSVSVSIVHPQDDARSVTLAVIADSVSLSEGTPFAGFVPTVYGTPLDSWEELIERALHTAHIISTKYISELYEQVGFSMHDFLSGVGADMDTEQRQIHLNRRLEHAAMRRSLVNKAAQVMDGDIPEDRRDFATAVLESGWTLVDMAGKELSEVDGQ